MDISTYNRLVAETFQRIQAAFDTLDPDQVEAEATGDVIKLNFANGTKVILNTQKPVFQLWLAARTDAWHFDWDAKRQAWLDDRGRGIELLSLLKRLTQEIAGLDVPLA